MEANNRNRTIALAALFQCVEGVNQLATRGTVDQQLLSSCINSILIDEAQTPEELYGGMDGLSTGFKTLMTQLDSSTMTYDGRPKNIDSTRYAVNILYLERKLSTNEGIFKALMDGISKTQQQLEFFEATHTNMLARLAEVYTNTISKLGPRIMIKGDQNYLANPDNAAKIRALLLAGIRAALLWRQAGGNRWKLLFSRGSIQKEAQALLRA